MQSGQVSAERHQERAIPAVVLEQKDACPSCCQVLYQMRIAHSNSMSG
jgi:hypothetical protein